MKTASLLLATLVLSGCDGISSPNLPPPGPTPPPPPAQLPSSLQLVSRTAWMDSTGDYLPEPFVVRVVDASGVAVPGVKVSWGVEGGAGQFGTIPHRYDLFLPQTTTDWLGVAAVHYRPVAPGVSKVSASVGGLLPVYFHGFASGPAAVTIRAEPLFDCGGGNDPTRFNDPLGILPVGTQVTWEYAAWLDPSCLALLRSTNASLNFVSSFLRPGNRFTFTLDLPGDWTYQDGVNGGKGVLYVR